MSLYGMISGLTGIFRQPPEKPSQSHSTHSTVLYINNEGKAQIGTYSTDLEFVHITDRKCQTICLNTLESVRKLISVNTSLNAVNLSGFKFVEGNSDPLKPIIDAIKLNPSIILLCFTVNLLSEAQFQELRILATCSEKKGIRLIDSDNAKLPAIFNWDAYYAELRLKENFQITPTTAKGLELFKKEHKRLPKSTLDYGAGEGRNCLNLLSLGVKPIVALDADAKALCMLHASVPRHLQGDISCVAQSFMKHEFNQKFEFIVVSYTLPYRPEEDFKACWNKCVGLLEIGGIICGEFFGPKKTNADKAMTYHNEEEIRKLLQESNLWLLDIDYHIPTVKGANPNAGEASAQAPWGDKLFHIVAVKIQPPH